MKGPTTQILAGTILLGMLLIPISGARAQISIRTALSDDREVTAGFSYEGTILVRNETDVQQEARVYQTDYLFYDDGSNAYDDAGSTERSNANWIAIAPRQFVIPPAETLPVNYVVSVPDEPLSGTFWSMIMIESVPRDSPESVLSSDDREQKFGVSQVLRYGVQVASHFPTNGDADIQILRTELVEDTAGKALFNLSLENQGSRMVRPTIWLDLYDSSGNLNGRRPGATNRIYPTTSVRQRFDLGRLQSGVYRALVFVDAGGDEVLGAEYSLQID